MFDYNNKEDWEAWKRLKADADRPYQERIAQNNLNFRHRKRIAQAWSAHTGTPAQPKPSGFLLTTTPKQEKQP